MFVRCHKYEYYTTFIDIIIVKHIFCLAYLVLLFALISIK